MTHLYGAIETQVDNAGSNPLRHMRIRPRTHELPTMRPEQMLRCSTHLALSAWLSEHFLSNSVDAEKAVVIDRVWTEPDISHSCGPLASKSPRKLQARTPFFVQLHSPSRPAPLHQYRLSELCELQALALTSMTPVPASPRCGKRRYSRAHRIQRLSKASVTG
jgi:hypothetical protein